LCPINPTLARLHSRLVQLSDAPAQPAPACRASLFKPGAMRPNENLMLIFRYDPNLPTDLRKRFEAVLSIDARITRHSLRHIVVVPEGSALSMRGLRRQRASVGGGVGDGVSFLCAIPNS